MLLGIALVMALPGCGSHASSAQTNARHACESVRESIGGKHLDPKRTYPLLDRAAVQALQAARADARYNPLRQAIDDFRTTLHGPSDYPDAARFGLAAHTTKKECQKQVHIDIGVIG